MKILFCPSHYALLDDRGSELEWAYKITNSIATLYPHSVAVTGFTNISNSHFDLIELQKNMKRVDMGLLNSLIFTFKYGIYGTFRLFKNDFDIHHHILPFSLDRTFNIAFFLPGKKTVKVIGPIQKPLPFYADNVHNPNDKLSMIKRASNIFTHSFLTIFDYFLTTLSDATLRKADVLIVINEEVEKLLLEKSIPKSKIIVIPPGISTKKYVLKEKTTETVHIMCAGALIERKGMDVVIRGFAEALKRSSHKLHLDIFGDGPQKEKLVALLQELHITKHVTMYGHVPHNKMPNYYQKSTVFISMSRAESWGQMYLEAMASGLAVLTTRNSGSNAIIENNVTGMFIKNDDYKDLSDKILLFTENSVLMNKLGMQAKKSSEKYDWEKSIIPMYLVLYNKIINENTKT